MMLTHPHVAAPGTDRCSSCNKRRHDPVHRYNVESDPSTKEEQGHKFPNKYMEEKTAK